MIPIDGMWIGNDYTLDHSQKTLYSVQRLLDIANPNTQY